MRAVVQRVARAQVRVDGRVVGAIGRGLLVLVGFAPGDGDDQIDWAARKIVNLRVFPDEYDRMNLNLKDVGGAILVVSQFTLYADIQKGRRPAFVNAAPPDLARSLYERFCRRLKDEGAEVQTGSFGDVMEVDLINEGPVTILIER